VSTLRRAGGSGHRQRQRCVGAYLVHHRVVEVTEPTTHIISEQGAEINRPSTLYVEVDSRSEEITAVRVGGQVVLVAEGIVRL
jgi:trans-2,3-dihydro-3-hydroxyanthranilate isomerase